MTRHSKNLRSTFWKNLKSRLGGYYDPEKLKLKLNIAYRTASAKDMEAALKKLDKYEKAQRK